MSALVAGVGSHSELGRSLVRALQQNALGPVVTARGVEAAHALQAELDVPTIAVDLTDEASTKRAVATVERDHGPIECCVHTAARFHRQPLEDTSVAVFRSVWEACALSAFVLGRAVARPMVERRRGTILITGATASTRGGAGFGAFAAAKFALRGLAQSMARELGPRGVHVAHVVVDGVIWGRRADDDFGMSQADCIRGDDLAEVFVQLHAQPSSAWTHELDVRPAAERF